MHHSSSYKLQNAAQPGIWEASPRGSTPQPTSNYYAGKEYLGIWALLGLFTLWDYPGKNFMHFLREGMRWWIACYIWIMGDLVSLDPGMNVRGRKSLKINTLGAAIIYPTFRTTNCNILCIT